MVQTDFLCTEAQSLWVMHHLVKVLKLIGLSSKSELSIVMAKIKFLCTEVQSLWVMYYVL